MTLERRPGRVTASYADGALERVVRCRRSIDRAASLVTGPGFAATPLSARAAPPYVSTVGRSYWWPTSVNWGMPSLFEPMLATSGDLPEDEERWAFEPKWDGFRAIVQVNGRAVVWSRRGTDWIAFFEASHD